MHPPDAKRLPEERRREIFLALVEAQDKDLNVPLSREGGGPPLRPERGGGASDRARRAGCILAPAVMRLGANPLAGPAAGNRDCEAAR